jgi:hypothetical protein
MSQVLDTDHACLDLWHDHILAINASSRQTPLRTRKQQPVFVLRVCPGPRAPRGQDVPKGRVRGDSPVFQCGPALPDRSISSHYAELRASAIHL